MHKLIKIDSGIRHERKADNSQPINNRLLHLRKETFVGRNSDSHQLDIYCRAILRKLHLEMTALGQ